MGGPVFKSRFTYNPPQHPLIWALVIMGLLGLSLLPGLLVGVLAPEPVAAVVGPLFCPAGTRAEVNNARLGRRLEQSLLCRDGSGQVVARAEARYQALMIAPWAVAVLVGAYRLMRALDRRLARAAQPPPPSAPADPDAEPRQARPRPETTDDA